MSKTKEWLLVGTILLAVALGSAHATPFDGVLMIAQAPQADQEKEKEKKPPAAEPATATTRCCSCRCPGGGGGGCTSRQVQPPPPPPPQRTPFVFIYMDTPSIEALDANDSRTKCICCQRILGLCADPVAAYPVKTRSLR